MQLKENTPRRGIEDIGPGDFVFVSFQGESNWERVESVSLGGYEPQYRSWTVRTEEGRTWGTHNIIRYAKAEDFEN